MPPRLLYLADGDLDKNTLAPIAQAAQEDGRTFNWGLLVSPTDLASSKRRRTIEKLREACGGSPRVSYLCVSYQSPWFSCLSWQVRRWISEIGPICVHARGTLAAGASAKAIERLPAHRRPRLIYEVIEPRPLNETPWLHELRKDALQRSEHIFVPSASALEQLRRSYSYGGTGEVIPHWGPVPIDFRAPTDELRNSVRQALKIPKDAFVWCCALYTDDVNVATLASELILRLNNDNPQHMLFFLCHEAGERIQRFIESQAIGRDAFRIGVASREDFLRWMVAGDAAIVSMTPNGLSGSSGAATIPDYLLCGLPLMAIHAETELARWIRDWLCGEIVPSTHHDDVYASAIKLIKRVEITGREQMRKKTRSLFDEKFDYRLYEPKYKLAWNRFD